MGYQLHSNKRHQDKVYASFSNILYDLALKLLGTPPLADALEAVTVVAVGEDAEATLAGIGLLEHHLHAHAAHHVLTALDGERDLHVLLVGLDACLSCTTAQHALQTELNDVSHTADKSYLLAIPPGK